MNQVITIDFYMVTDSEGAPQDLSNMMTTIARTGQVRQDYHGDVHIFEDIKQNARLWQGDITRVRTDLPVVRGNAATGETEVIPCDEHQGPYEKSAFLYHPGTCTLVLQRNRAGASTKAFTRLVENQTDAEPPIQLQSLLEKEKWERLSRMRDVTRFEIKVAGLQNPGVLRDAGVGVAAIGDFMRRMESPSLQLIASIGRGNRYHKLNAENVKQAARKLLGLSTHAPEVTKIEVAGHGQDDERDVIDLISGRICERIEVGRSSDKTLLFDDRIEALHRAWDMRHQEVKELYSEHREDSSI